MATFYMTHSAELYHYGVLGMKWGVRRYQNPDGSLTAAGKAKYAKSYKGKLESKIESDYKNRKDRSFSKKDSASITLRKERRDLEAAHGKRVLASWVAAVAGTAAAGALNMPLAAISGLGIFAGTTIASALVNMNKDKTIADLYDEYNIPDSQRRMTL